ncbi:MAG: ABC transporter substrate-binding protein [Deltaproteobacteria bacterium]|nr:ABC transporter substrate-binding protein [Deltaproteobacteria bacterium]MCD6138909.1 ABC transporter substrate-binding protein [Deltaproteobacteria bacterium]RLB90823.1 MAG: amino acid ABC transporter substrate-binding protein [Deltaproteobacteria bacterium]RLB94538.1 MAG: amino acid ABC transporter substrate-binding protein [Deltaproteobacteria bacterium]
MRKFFSLLCVGIMTLGLVGAAHGESTLDKIKKRGYMIGGVKDTVRPFGYVDEKTNKLIGFDCDILRYIAKRLGVGIKFKPVTSQTRIPTLVEGNVDILAATMTHTKSRDEQIDYSITYFYDGQKLLVRKGSGIKSYKDLAGRKVSSAKGSTSEQNIIRVQPKAKVVSFENYPEAFLALKQGKSDAVTTDSTILLGLKASDPNPEKYEIVGDFFSDEPYGLGLPENDSKWRDFVNESLIECWNSGEYIKIYNKWFGPDTKYYLPLGFKLDTWPLR